MTLFSLKCTRKKRGFCLFSNNSFKKSDLADMRWHHHLSLSLYRPVINRLTYGTWNGQIYSHHSASLVWFHSTHRWNSRGANCKTAESGGCALQPKIWHKMHYFVRLHKARPRSLALHFKVDVLKYEERSANRKKKSNTNTKFINQQVLTPCLNPTSMGFPLV